jgi:Ca2+-binding EF-hand superfamily protein
MINECMYKILILFFLILLLNAEANSAEEKSITKKQFIDNNLKKLEQQFDAIDTNKDGKMTEAEEKAYIKKIQEIRQVRQALLKLADTDNDGKVTGEEQKKLLIIIDVNKDGDVTLEEQKAYLKKIQTKK